MLSPNIPIGKKTYIINRFFFKRGNIMKTTLCLGFGGVVLGLWCCHTHTNFEISL